MQKNNNNNLEHVPNSGTAISWACFVISFIRMKQVACHKTETIIYFSYYFLFVFEFCRFGGGGCGFRCESEHTRMGITWWHFIL